MARALLLVSLVFAFLGAPPAQAERRRALVVGISEYRELPNIVRSAQDARVIHDALARIGVETELLLEPDTRAFDEAVDQFTRSLHDGDIALVYFAGHAARIRGEFTLLAADAPPLGIRPEERRRGFGLALHVILDDVKAAGARAQVVIVDACRGDPYAGDGRELALSPSMGRPFVAPPGVPAERVAMLRKAFDATIRDREFLAEAAASKLEIDPTSGDKLAEIAERTLRASPDTVRRAKQAMAK